MPLPPKKKQPGGLKQVKKAPPTKPAVAVTTVPHAFEEEQDDKENAFLQSHFAAAMNNASLQAPPSLPPYANPELVFGKKSSLETVAHPTFFAYTTATDADTIAATAATAATAITTVTTAATTTKGDGKVAGKASIKEEAAPMNFAFASTTASGGDADGEWRPWSSSKKATPPIDQSASPVAGKKAYVHDAAPMNFAYVEAAADGGAQRRTKKTAAGAAPDPALAPVAGRRSIVEEKAPFNFAFGDGEVGEGRTRRPATPVTASVGSSSGGGGGGELAVAGKRALVAETHPYFFAFDGETEVQPTAMVAAAAAAAATAPKAVDDGVVHGRRTVREDCPTYWVWAPEQAAAAAVVEEGDQEAARAKAGHADTSAVAGKPSFKADVPPTFFAWEEDAPAPAAPAYTHAHAPAPAASWPAPEPDAVVYGKPNARADPSPYNYAWAGAAGGRAPASAPVGSPAARNADVVYGKPSFKADAPPTYYAWAGAATEVASAAVGGGQEPAVAGVDPSFVAGRANLVAERPPYYYAWPEDMPAPRPATAPARVPLLENGASSALTTAVLPTAGAGGTAVARPATAPPRNKGITKAAAPAPATAPKRTQKTAPTPAAKNAATRATSGRPRSTSQSTDHDPVHVNPRYPPASDKINGRWASTSQSTFKGQQTQEKKKITVALAKPAQKR